jgi:hypothetical protein
MYGDRLGDDALVADSDAHAIGADLREAYARGRRDERALRRRHPVAMTLTFLAAAAGAALLGLAGASGSFAKAGALVDAGLQAAMSWAAPAASEAAHAVRSRVAGAPN